MRTKPSRDLTLPDRLSHLSPGQAQLLLGPRAKRLLIEGGKVEIDIDEHVHIDDQRYLVNLPGGSVRLELDAARRDKLALSCTCGTEPCLHQGAALAFLLEEKTVLGLAKPPPEDLPLESLTASGFVERELAERAERAKEERMRVRPLDPSRPWSDYLVDNPASGRSYRVALRGEGRGVSYCSCPDFKKNALGTCKHVLKALAFAKRKFGPAELAKPYVRTRASLAVRYGEAAELVLLLPDDLPKGVAAVLEPLARRPITRLRALLAALEQAEAHGHPVKVYPDARECLEQRLSQERLSHLARQIRVDPEAHPLRTELLKVELLPYQLDGVAFLAGAGRAILADEMGLGKTIQAIGMAELLARQAGISSVLVICPASVKAQWRSEIQRFCSRSVELVAGSGEDRARRYGQGSFFTVCNYEQVLRDILAIEKVGWDLIVLDEAQRIKNWEARTTRVLKGLRSRFALALSGTPLENRLEELYSVVEFVDDRRLGSMSRFHHRHRLVGDDGRARGYGNLDDLRATLAPVMLRRTRALVMKDLPSRSVEIVRIPPTRQQKELNDNHASIVASIVSKSFLTEMDLLRLRKALLMARMAADSTYLVDKQRPSYSSKLERLQELLAGLLAERGRKIVLFSEWTTMLDEIEAWLSAQQIAFLRLDGSVPQGQRPRIVGTFQRDDAQRILLMTNAGSVGLNLQSANTVVNVDLPWNPAVLEQRIGRVHRMGQKRRVQVYVLVTEATIEDGMLETLDKKHALANAALDPDSTVDLVEMRTSSEDLKRRLEVLLGHRSDAAVDAVQRKAAERAAGIRKSLESCLKTLPDGKLELHLPLPDLAAFEGFVSMVTAMVAGQNGQPRHEGVAASS